MAHGTREFTKDKLHKMEDSGRGPSLDRDNDALGDDFGFTAAGSSNSAKLSHGGKAEGHAKKPHLGRANRATGGRTGPTRDMTKASTDITHLPDNVKLRARGGRTHRAAGGWEGPPGPGKNEWPAHPNETPSGKAPPRLRPPVLTLPEEDQADRRRGGRTHNAEHRHHRADGGRSEGARDAEGDAKTSRMSATDKDSYANEKRGGRIHRASGGRAGKGKTVVNVIIGRGGPSQGAPMPPPMAGPPPMPPAPPPRPPMIPPGGMPSPGMPPLGVGAPPPGAMPMRARGGKVDGHYNFGAGGTEAKATCKKAGGGGGEGRLEKAHREGARY